MFDITISKLAYYVICLILIRTFSKKGINVKIKEEQTPFTVGDSCILERNNIVFKKFEEVERSTKFTFVENGKTKWVGLNVAAGDEDFSTFIGKIFDVAKSQVKSKGTTSLRISSRAKEFVSNLVLQFLQSLTQRFNIYINHKCKIEPNIKSGGEVKKRQEEKSIKFETLVMTLEMLLCSDNDTMKTNNDTVKLLIDKICTFKSKLREINQLKLKK
jgi:hypothetical protein